MRRRLAVPAAWLILTLAVGLIFPVGAAAASTLLVPSQYPTIQAAVNAASPGDTILVGPGVYFEQVSIGKSVTIVGSGATRTRFTCSSPTRRGRRSSWSDAFRAPG